MTLSNAKQLLNHGDTFTPVVALAANQYSGSTQKSVRIR